jgi:hypothetical protein
LKDAFSDPTFLQVRKSRRNENVNSVRRLSETSRRANLQNSGSSDASIDTERNDS